MLSFHKDKVVNKPANDSSSKIVGLLTKAGNGIYYFKPDLNEVQELEPTVYSQAKQGSGLLTSITYGIAQAKSKLSVSGASANIQLSDKRPRFYFYEVYFETDVSPGEYCFMYAGAACGSETVNSKLYDFGIK